MSLYNAFAESRKIAWARLAPNNGTLFCMLPWLTEHLFDLEDAMGPDPFAYGMGDNRSTLETFFGYSLEQGMVRKPMTPEDLFAPETLNT
jgi:4,5-dihydroxyphthalate decarboxylase